MKIRTNKLVGQTGNRRQAEELNFLFRFSYNFVMAFPS